MTIVLIRHGKPAIDAAGKMSATDFGQWIKKYDQAEIDSKSKPANKACEIANTCSFIVCSNLPRSLSSATALNIETPNMVSHLFRECEMPHANWKYAKLSVTSWSILFRICQLCGYSPNAEPFQDIKKRVEECAKQLVDLSQKHESVLFVGHGVLIWFLHKHLKRTGWTGPAKAAKKHWEYGVYAQ